MKKDQEQSLVYDQKLRSSLEPVLNRYATKYCDFAKAYIGTDQTTEKLREMEALSTLTGMEYIKAKEELEIAKILLQK